jgi:hypothetical protein
MRQDDQEVSKMGYPAAPGLLWAHNASADG